MPATGAEKRLGQRCEDGCGGWGLCGDEDGVSMGKGPEQCCLLSGLGPSAGTIPDLAWRLSPTHRRGPTG